jgi:hypothetical protein
MSTGSQDSALPLEDVFWNEHTPLFTTQFPSYYREPQKVWGRFHISGERFRQTSLEIIPLKEKEGKRVYVLMHPFVYEPYFNFTVKLNDKPKHYHDQESPIGQVVHSRQNGFREVAIGSAQAWYYPTDKTVVLWECFFHSPFSTNPLSEDVNMKKLWKGFERWLIAQFGPPGASSGKFTVRLVGGD